MSIFLQIWTRKYVYIWNNTRTWSDTIRPCQNIHRIPPEGGGCPILLIFNFQNTFDRTWNEIRMKIQTELFFGILISTRLLIIVFWPWKLWRSIIHFRQTTIPKYGNGKAFGFSPTIYQDYKKTRCFGTTRMSLPWILSWPKIIQPEWISKLICNLWLYTLIPKIKSISQIIVK
jgi:hypothetical protein